MQCKVRQWTVEEENERSAAKVALVLMPLSIHTQAFFYACLFHAPCQFTPLFILRFPVFSLTVFGWFICIWVLFCTAYKRHDDPPINGQKKNGTEVNNRSNNFNGSSMYMSVLTWLCETKSNSQWQRLWQARNCKYIIRGKPNNYETGWKAETTTNNTAHGLTTITPTCIKLARQKP